MTSSLLFAGDNEKIAFTSARQWTSILQSVVWHLEHCAYGLVLLMCNDKFITSSVYICESLSENSLYPDVQ